MDWIFPVTSSVRGTEQFWHRFFVQVAAIEMVIYANIRNRFGWLKVAAWGNCPPAMQEMIADI